MNAATLRAMTGMHVSPAALCHPSSRLLWARGKRGVCEAAFTRGVSLVRTHGFGPGPIDLHLVLCFVQPRALLCGPWIAPARGLYGS